MMQTQPPYAAKAVIHCDVDCFYCQVETLDDPALADRPLAVHQGNSGGFVAVNYQARAAGIRCGDGSELHNLAARTFQHENNMSLQEAQQLCPGLVTKPMRSDRYRQVSAQILSLISQHATNGQCEKTSYDDFYLEVLPEASALPALAAWQPLADHEVYILGGSDFSALPAVLKLGVQVAGNIRAAVRQEMGLSMSFGVAVGKLAARLAGPLHKPSGMTVVPPHHAPAFLLDTPILKIPHLRGRVGKQVVEQLSVEHVRDLAAFQAIELTDLFGTTTGQLLFDLGHCIDDKRVQAKGPQQSICCTKSYHGLRDFGHIHEALQRLVFALWPRLLEERSISGRVPAKLKLSCKQGGREQQVRSYTLPFPHTAAKQLQATALGSVDPSASQSSAVHTLIPNLAPRSRLQHPGLPNAHSQQSLHSLPDRNNQYADTVGAASRSVLAGTMMPDLAGSQHTGQLQSQASSPSNAGQQVENGADGLLPATSHCIAPTNSCSTALPSSNDDTAQGGLESGPHQLARNAIFQAVMGLLKPKLVQPVLVNFMSVAGEYAKAARLQADGSQGGMLRFLQSGSSTGMSDKAVVASQLSRHDAEGTHQVTAGAQLQPELTEWLTVQCAPALTSFKPQAVPDKSRWPQKRTLHELASQGKQQPSTITQRGTKLPKTGAGPMDRFLSKCQE